MEFGHITLSSLQLVPVTRIRKILRNDKGCDRQIGDPGGYTYYGGQ